VPHRPCLRCGALTTDGSYCREHVPAGTRQTPGRGSGGQAAAFRAAVLTHAGGRCEAIVNGKRCEVTDKRKLQAHHVHGLREGGSNDPWLNGVLLCTEHHRQVEQTAA
jgi:hypothetical protein